MQSRYSDSEFAPEQTTPRLPAIRNAGQPTNLPPLVVGAAPDSTQLSGSPKSKCCASRVARSDGSAMASDAASSPRQRKTLPALLSVPEPRLGSSLSPRAQQSPRGRGDVQRLQLQPTAPDSPRLSSPRHTAPHERYQLRRRKSLAALSGQGQPELGGPFGDSEQSVRISQTHTGILASVVSLRPTPPGLQTGMTSGASTPRQGQQTESGASVSLAGQSSNRILRRRTTGSKSCASLAALADSEAAMGRSSPRQGRLRPALQISATGEIIRMDDMRFLLKTFQDLDTDNDGRVAFSKLNTTSQGERRVSLFSMKNLQDKHKVFMDADDGGATFTFPDMLRMNYSRASSEDISQMLALAKRVQSQDSLHRAHETLGNTKWKKACRLFDRLANRDEGDDDTEDEGESDHLDGDGDGEAGVSMNALESYLNDNYPFQQVYRILKSIKKEALDRMYDGGTLTKTEFMSWIVAQRILG